MNKKLILLGIVFIGIIFLVPFTVAGNDDVILAYGENVEYSITIVAGEKMTWSFETSDQQFQVTVSMNGELISQLKTSDSGTYTATETGTFDLIFKNVDSATRDGNIHIEYTVGMGGTLKEGEHVGEPSPR